MRYKDVLDPEILDAFGKYADKIGNFNLIDKYVNAKILAKAINIPIRNSVMNISEIIRQNHDSPIIVVNLIDDSEKQNYSIAMQLGTILLDDKDSYERTSIQFANQLLMPKKLINYWMKQYAEEKHLAKMQDANVDNLINYLSKNMQISKKAIKYQLINLKYIV